jgi:hypothetical protein
VGLLASCYDSISADTLKRAEEFASGDETLGGEDSTESAGDDDQPEG